MDIVLATRNEGKLREYRRLLSGVPGLVLRTMDAVGASVEVDEDCETFEGNAYK